MGRDAGEEGVLGTPEVRDTCGLTLEVGDPSHPLGGDDFETPYVHAGEEHRGVPLVQSNDVGSHEVQADVRLRRHEQLRCRTAREIHVGHVGEALGPEEVLGDVLGGPAGSALFLEEPQLRRFGRWLRSGALRSHPEARRRHQGQPTHELASAPARSLVGHGDLLHQVGDPEYSPPALDLPWCT